MNGSCRLSCAAASLAFFVCALRSAGQETNPAPVPSPQSTETANASAVAPLRLTLQDALDRARKNSVQFQAALTTAALARQDRMQARNALLPTVTYNNSAIYTQGVPLGTEASMGPQLSSLRITRCMNTSAKRTSTKSSMPRRLRIFGEWAQPPQLRRRRRKSPREGWWLQSFRIITRYRQRG